MTSGRADADQAGARLPAPLRGNAFQTGDAFAAPEARERILACARRQGSLAGSPSCSESKSNRLTKEPASASNELSPIRPNFQLSSMNRKIED